jgi:two-component system cell cycle sensor histidine kinase/response regulator CckA
MRDYTISELVDLATIQKLAEAVYQVTGMPIGIIDAIDGSILVATGWQDICTLFHRAHPSSLKNCQESDNYIKENLIDGEACPYRCKNGMWDIGVPVIVAKRHLATIFLGQFFYEGERADRGRFIRQAQEYGYNLSEYLTALDRVPVFTKEKVDDIITYNKMFSRFLTDLAENSIRNFEAEKALKDSVGKYQAIVETFDGLIYICSDNYRIEFMNDKFVHRTGRNAVGELCYKALHDRDSVCPWCVNERVFAGETVRWELQSPKDGRWYYVVNAPIRNADGSMSKQSMIMDTTERKVAEEERKITIEFLSLVNACTGTQALLSAAAAFFRQHSGCEAVDVRLNETDEYPHSEAQLPVGITRAEQQFRCNGEGYESTALIPLNFGQERLGSIELNDRRKGLFSPEIIELWERLAGYLAAALAKCRSEDALRKAKVDLRRSHDELEKRIAERTKQLENTVDALRTSEERYVVAVQGSNDGIWDLHLATGDIFFSPRWKSMLGYEDDEFPNTFEEWRKRIHQDDLNSVMEARNACLNGQIPTYEIEYRLQHKDGSFRWIHARGICQRDLKGKPTRFSGSHTDITDRKKIENTLRKSEKKYRTLFEKSKDTIFILDPARRIIDINQAGIELFGYSREELFSRQLEKLFCQLEDWELLWEKTVRSGFVSDFEVEMMRKDDRKIVVHFSMSAIRDDEGHIAGCQGIIHNITDRKLLERQLMQSQKMESIGILAGGVAHDFNNLLTAISGYGEILSESIRDDDHLSRESIRNVLKAADRAAELTKALLAFSRKQLINPKPVLLDSLINDTGKIIQRIIGEDIQFSVDFTCENLLVKADPGQIEQVLMNLATNAHDAMPTGGNLSITTKKVIVEEGSEKLYDLPSHGKYALISVADSGTGIDKKTLQSIFEPFFTTKEVGKGTGLGLSIVHGIIKQHNGSVLASSQLGKGTTFDIFLPLINGQFLQEKAHLTSQYPGGNETLLVVEDDETVRMFIKRILERAGYRVIIAEDGEEAVVRFRENDDISLVLSDVVMPRKNGREMLEEIKKLKPGIKGVFISGYTAEAMQKKGMFDGTVDAMEIIKKPFRQEDLLKKIREVLDKTVPSVPPLAMN